MRVWHVLLMFVVMMLWTPLVVVVHDYWKEKPAPDQVIDASALGRQMIRPLAASLADGFDAGADVLDKGGTVADSDNVLKQKFSDSRNAAFKAKVAPVFAAVVPEGTEPKDAASRKDFASLYRSFAKGLRSK